MKDVIKKLSAKALETAALSKCKKRKVGATVALIDPDGSLYACASGYNYNSDGNDFCEDENGKTLSTIVHAEIAALDAFKTIYPAFTPNAIFITHAPCTACLDAVFAAGIEADGIHIAEQFMKFDTTKIRMDLLPASAVQYAENSKLFKQYLIAKELQSSSKLHRLGKEVLKLTSLAEVAEILTFGAKKYKPNNWRNVDDVSRYWAALGRHLVEVDKSKKSKDSDSGLTHAAHAMTNILFILELWKS